MNFTLKDIAKRAGVSVSTVSRVINNDPQKSASPKTAEKVWAIVHELQYTPNQTARRLIQMSKDGSEKVSYKSIGCILAAYEELYSDPFFSEVIAGIQQEVNLHGYSMEYTFSVSATDGSQDAAFFNAISTRKVDGAILLGRFSHPLYSMVSNYIPNLLYCGLNYLDTEVSQVICDSFEGISQLVNYLVNKGHKKIGFVGETNRDNRLINERRFVSFRKAMEENALKIDNRFVVESVLSLSQGYHSMQRALKKNGEFASAYVCVNDITAIGVMRAIQERGLSIPDDISIVSFDDIEMCSYIAPKLTTIRTPMKQMGQIAVRTLLDHMQAETVPVRIYVPFKLVERDSCRSINVSTG